MDRKGLPADLKRLLPRLPLSVDDRRRVGAIVAALDDRGRTTVAAALEAAFPGKALDTQDKALTRLAGAVAAHTGEPVRLDLYAGDACGEAPICTGWLGLTDPNVVVHDFDRWQVDDAGLAVATSELRTVQDVYLKDELRGAFLVIDDPGLNAVGTRCQRSASRVCRRPRRGCSVTATGSRRWRSRRSSSRPS